jgi:hypothetical protein
MKIRAKLKLTQFHFLLIRVFLALAVQPQKKAKVALFA